ncbi:MutS-related protein [Desmospora profundinema]|nr:hypothetical protein [Desmospora profundinema]
MDNQSRRALRWAEIWDRFRPLTPMGQRAKKALSPFMPTEVATWECHLDEQERCLKRAEQDPDWESRVGESLSRIPDVEPVVTQLERGGVPPIVGWFRLKALVWHGRKLAAEWPLGERESILRDRKAWEAVWRIVNPGPVAQPSFALDDALDPRLSSLRRKVAQWERERMDAEEERAREVERQHHVRRNRDGEWIVERESVPYRALLSDPRVERVRETPFEGVFRPLGTDRGRQAFSRRQQAEEELEQVEQEVLASLAEQMRPHLHNLRQMLLEVVRIDLQWARIQTAREWNGIRPRLDADAFRLEGAVHPLTASALARQGRTFTPLDVTIDRGATVVIGPNMGGKTMAIKTVGLIAALGQFGFFVPARSCRMPLVSWIRAVIGDGQDERDGLSTFAAEVVRVAEGMNRTDGGLLLLDEVGRGTNPDEGAALAAAVAEALAASPFWSFQSTHFREVLEVAGIRIYRTAGLKNPHTWKDDGGVSVDYRLLPGAGEGVPRQALLIAEGLGLAPNVLEGARRRIKGTLLREEEGDGSQTAVGRKSD